MPRVPVLRRCRWTAVYSPFVVYNPFADSVCWQTSRRSNYRSFRIHRLENHGPGQQRSICLKRVWQRIDTSEKAIDGIPGPRDSSQLDSPTSLTGFIRMDTSPHSFLGTYEQGVPIYLKLLVVN
jgi:hypothetical protein